MRHQGTLTVLMNFFSIALLHFNFSGDCWGTKDELFLLPDRQRHAIIFIFYCNIRVLRSIRFSILTPFSTSTLESEVKKEEEEEEEDDEEKNEGQSVSEEEEIELSVEDETFLNTGEKPETLRYQGTLTVLITFFPN